MDGKTLFQVGVKLMGLWLCLGALVALIQFGVSAIWTRGMIHDVESEVLSGIELWQWGWWSIAVTVKLVFGVYLIRWGTWISNLAFPVNRAI
ncbi:MAG: hypothetical protein AAF823_11180 [Planctomycetota bacterium]